VKVDTFRRSCPIEVVFLRFLITERTSTSVAASMMILLVSSVWVRVGSNNVFRQVPMGEHLKYFQPFRRRIYKKTIRIWLYRKYWLSCDRKYKSKIEETPRVCAAINSFETIFSKNVVPIYVCFFMPANLQKYNNFGEGWVGSWSKWNERSFISTHLFLFQKY
jgi:hypothetical protein